MKTQGIETVDDHRDDLTRAAVWHPSSRPDYLHLVTASEVEGLRNDLTKRHVPSDLEAKLSKLSKGGLAEARLEQNCRRMIELLEASLQGSFRGATERECHQLLRVLAYVRRDDDAIPDYRLDGFSDDQQEMNAFVAGHRRLVTSFKAWRLAHQVPLLWAADQAAGSRPRLSISAPLLAA